MRYPINIQDSIFNELADSDTGLDTICKKHNISPSKFREFILSDSDCGTKYAQARRMQIECIENRIQDASNDLLHSLTNGTVDPQIASAYVAGMRLKIDSMKWILSKLMPKKYGDKLDVTSDSKPVNVAISPIQAKEISKQLENEV